jgi:hypothetical protein
MSVSIRSMRSPSSLTCRAGQVRMGAHARSELLVGLRSRAVV